MKLLDPTRQRPNRLVIELGAGLLDVPHVRERFDGWRARFAPVRLADYYAETEFAALEAEGATNSILPVTLLQPQFRFRVVEDRFRGGRPDAAHADFAHFH